MTCRSSTPVRLGGTRSPSHNWTRENAGLFDVSHMGQLLLSGPDLDRAVEAVLPIDLGTLNVGQQRYSLLLDGDGGRAG